MIMPRNTIKDFWDKVNIMDSADCWEWTGGRSKKGYGQINLILFGKSHILTHRISWMLFNKMLVPDDLQILHSCDNKLCCNPKHLSSGTNLENIVQAIDRGLRKVGTVLTVNEVRSIRDMEGQMTYEEIACIFNVHRSTVGRIINKQRRAGI